MKNMPQLNVEQIKYIKDRGFEVINGNPPKGEPYPHLRLRERQEHFPEGEIEYHTNEGGKDITKGICHPSGKPAEELVPIIEQMVANGMNKEGTFYTTTPGDPIKVFVVDSAWDQVAKRLVDMYLIMRKHKDMCNNDNCEYIDCKNFKLNYELFEGLPIPLSKINPLFDSEDSEDSEGSNPRKKIKLN